MSSSSSSSSSLYFVNKIVVVTGGGSGIGAALCKAFATAGAIVMVVDKNGSEEQVLQSLLLLSTTKCHEALHCDVTDGHQVQQMIQRIKQTHGRIDIYCSNAGIVIPSSTIQQQQQRQPTLQSSQNHSVLQHSDDEWDQIWQVNVQSHVMAARELIPDWEQEEEEGGGVGNNKKNGHFLITASAAGLLTQIGNVSYGVTKAAAVSLAEHLAIAHGHKKKKNKNVYIHCLCPQAVNTPLIQGMMNTTMANSAASSMVDGILSPEYVADCCLVAIVNQEFWIFPHPQVQEYVQRRALDHDRWLKGMQAFCQKLQQKQQQEEEEHKQQQLKNPVPPPSHQSKL